MKDFRVCLRSLMRSFRPMAWKVSLSILLGILSVCLSLTFVWMSKRVVDIATGTADGSLIDSSVILCAIMLAQIVIGIASKYWNGLVTIGAQNDGRLSAFGKVMGSVWSGQDKFHSGDAVNRLEEDIHVTTEFLCTSVPGIIVTLFQLIASTVYIFRLQPSLAWILVLIMPVAVIGSRLFFKKLRSLTSEIRAGDSRVQGHMQESIQHRVLINTLGGPASTSAKLKSLQDYVRERTVTRLQYGAVSRGFLNVGFTAGYALVFLWSVFGLRNGTVTYGMMVAFMQLAGQVQRPVSSLAQQIPAFIKAISSEERLMELNELQQEESESPVLLDGVPGIRVSGLGFKYGEGCPDVFNGLDFDFTPGTITVITGPTGAGKSTLLRILLALMKPAAGDVTLYSGDFETSASVDTRCNFMYVPQGNSLMSGTIRENLLLGDADATEEQMRNALHIAAADFVLDLPDGIDTKCSEVGNGLSEGQAQRIATARALLRPGGIMLLDEATSALDADTEKLFLDRLTDRYRGKKTILFVTHRQAVSAFADQTLNIG